MKNIHAIILAGSIDFGRCKIASKIPVCNWPVLDKPAIIRILDWIHNSGIKSATICLDGDYSILEKEIISYSPDIKVDFLTETMPWGTAGCIREVIKSKDLDTFFVCKAAMLLPPSISDLLVNHINSNKLLTVAINPAQKHIQTFYEATGAYVCSKEIADYIPKLGYCDIKERLIPYMIQKGKKINAFLLEKKTGPFRDLESYYNSIQNSLSDLIKIFNKPDKYNIHNNNILIAKSASISSNTKLFGPVAILDNVKIEDSIIFGPTVISNNVTINSNSFLESSIIWNNTTIGNKSSIRKCLINTNATLPAKTVKNKEVIYS